MTLYSIPDTKEGIIAALEKTQMEILSSEYCDNYTTWSKEAQLRTVLRTRANLLRAALDLATVEDAAALQNATKQPNTPNTFNTSKLEDLP